MWQPIETAPKNTCILGEYPVEADAPYKDMGAWVVWQDDSGNWYGDHHSSWFATERTAPRRWMPLPAPTADLEREG